MREPGRWSGRAVSLALVVGIVLYASSSAGDGVASPLAQTAPTLGTAASFAVLGGSAVTNTGPTVVSGDLGVSPGSAISGFPPGTVVNGAIHQDDAVAAQAQSNVTTAYNNLAGQPCPPGNNLTGQDLGGMTLVPGVYCFDSSAQLTGALTLNGQGNDDAVFIFQIGSTLTTASGSSVLLTNDASPCNVFWQVGSSATLGTATSFVGSILALTSITLNTGADITSGRALARNGAVTMDTNDVSTGVCAAAPTATSTRTSTPTRTPTGTLATRTPTRTPNGTAATRTPTPDADNGDAGGRGGEDEEDNEDNEDRDNEDNEDNEDGDNEDEDNEDEDNDNLDRRPTATATMAPTAARPAVVAPVAATPAVAATQTVPAPAAEAPAVAPATGPAVAPATETPGVGAPAGVVTTATPTGVVRTPTPAGGVTIPAQLPRTGGDSLPVLGIAATSLGLMAIGWAVRGWLRRRDGRQIP